ncbi:MAG: site-specific DNA-methyltransferase [Phycisphaeraceae bacterium]|nr:site-specific DNA-methyltransferase [Phycisphaeraceae bacterium]
MNTSGPEHTQHASLQPGITLSWAGKRAPDISAVLARTQSQSLEVSSRSDAASSNILVRGECLAVACTLLEDFRGRIKLIYLDPPYAVGMDFDAALRTEQRPEPIFAYSDRWPTLDAYIQFLYERFIVCRELLSEDGSIYVHVDQRTSHWVRCILQEIFGREYDRGAIVWSLGNGAKSRSAWSCVHNDILCFSKGADFTFRHDHPALREPYAQTSIKSHFRKRDDQGRHFRTRQINGRSYHYYADQGRLVGSVWNDCPAMLSRSPILDESTGYPTQKPEKLLERIVEASSEPGDLVADFFCGSGTTAVVAQRLARRTIAADLGARAIETTAHRMLSEPNAASIQVREVHSEVCANACSLAALFAPNATWDESITAAIAETGDHRIIVCPAGTPPLRETLEHASLYAPSRTRCTLLATHFDRANFGSTTDDCLIQCLAYLPESATAASTRSLVFAGSPQLHTSVHDNTLKVRYTRPIYRFNTTQARFVHICDETRVLRWFAHYADSDCTDEPPFASGLNPGDSIHLPLSTSLTSPALLTIIDGCAFRHRTFISSLCHASHDSKMEPFATSPQPSVQDRTP